MIEIAIIDWFGRWGTSVFSENTAIFSQHFRTPKWPFFSISPRAQLAYKIYPIKFYRE